MKKYKWTDGAHDIDSNFRIVIENGVFKYGVIYDDIGGGITVYPYLPCKDGTLRRAYAVKACKRNFEKLRFR